eukprot:gnl/TRDRNA2_/TRDRNA2_41304_c0_seq1.p1 gnl/TRDRNA2_/TRDRNA2_41304_c0~~gnl/TRDRNA2_/TRDRNA2_41304_c0_seq1.p1  ORF type:complete len:166 (+),score=18.86 gnl/TRDRNA2_/TRDRNA2_41304_c0_seq1:73-570(+)
MGAQQGSNICCVQAREEKSAGSSGASPLSPRSPRGPSTPRLMRELEALRRENMYLREGIAKAMDERDEALSTARSIKSASSAQTPRPGSATQTPRPRPAPQAPRPGSVEIVSSEASAEEEATSPVDTSDEPGVCKPERELSDSGKIASAPKDVGNAPEASIRRGG